MRTVGTLILLVIFSGLIFSKFSYNFFYPFVGTGWAYVIDQGFPLLVALFFTIFYFSIVNKISFKQTVRQFLVTHGAYIAPLLLIVFIVHYFVFNYYFFSEDVTHILQSVQQGDGKFPFNPTNNGYPLLPFVFSFIFFGTNAVFYNIVSLSLFLVTVLGCYLLATSLTGNKKLAFFAALFFGTTPSFLDMFTWQASVQGMSQVLFLGLMTCVFFVYYQKSKNSFFYALSILFFISGIHTGFVRIAGTIFPLLFLIIFPLVKVKGRIWKKILQTLPYIVIWLEFIRIRFGMSLLFSFGNLGGKSASFDFSNYFSPLFYYLDHLFLPASLAKFLFPWLKNELFATFNFIQNVSFVYTFGVATLAALSFLALIAILKFRFVNWRMVVLSMIFIFGNLFYVPLLGSVPKDIALFDRQFINPAYNPGSRYVFSSAIGVSILFGLLVVTLISLKSKLKYVFLAFIFTILIVNGFITFSSHRKITNNISRFDRAFMENFFSMVPRDGKEKLVYAINPVKNMIDVNVGGSNWLYGFYKRDELFYTKDKEEVEFLIRSNKYDRENIYAFYVNPETNSFKDISSEVYDGIVSQEKKDLPINFRLGSPSSIVSDLGGVSFSRLTRAALESEDLNYRVLFENNLHLNLSYEIMTANGLPYSDIAVGMGDRYPYALWRIISNNYYQPAVFSKKENIPPEFILESFDSISLGKLSLRKKQEIISILREREAANNVRISASNIDTEDERVSEKALSDGLYASDPAPTSDERFYLSENSPVTFNMEFPYPIVLGRILLNAPKSHAGNFSPKEIEISSSYDGINYEKAGSVNDQIESGWSPNNGKMINVLLEPVLSNFLKVTLSNSASNLLLDEIVIDSYAALKYTPQQIADYENKAFLYVDSLDLLRSLISVKYYNQIPLVYACAEDDDWRKQKQDFKTLLPGVWKVAKIDLAENNAILPVNCDGTVLRKIIIFGPPFPSKLRAERVFISEKN